MTRDNETEFGRNLTQLTINKRNVAFGLSIQLHSEHLFPRHMQ